MSNEQNNEQQEEYYIFNKFADGYVLTDGDLTIRMIWTPTKIYYWYRGDEHDRRQYLSEEEVEELANDDAWEWKFNCVYSVDDVRQRISRGRILRGWGKQIEGRDVETEEGGRVRPILRENDTWSYVTWEEVARYASTLHWRWK